RPVEIQVLYDNMVYAILPGSQPGEYWFSTNYGLFKLSSDLQLTKFSREIGLQENEFNTGVCYKTKSGKLYFGGVNGITAFYPSDVTSSEDFITSYVSSISINNDIVARYITNNTVEDYVLSHKDNNIKIDLLARGNKSPLSYNYQYKMKGLNENWVDMGRKNELNFHLKPGSYTFLYYTGDGFNPDAQPSNGIHFRIRPPFYMQWWFIAIAIMALFGSAFYLFVQSKRRQALKLRYEYQLSQKIQKERMRISRELHDNIGAQMATVRRHINFLVSHNDTLSREQVFSKMNDLDSISTQINQELRDTIWATQNEHLSLSDFIARLKNYVFQQLGPDSTCRVQYEEHCDKEIILGPFLALNLHRICQEAINNIIKHSGATEIRIRFESADKNLEIKITDNGKGFKLDSVNEGYGLKNIQHRAMQVGAEVFFDTKTGEGTSLNIKLKDVDTVKTTDGWKE
ncbi:MAG TPA: ATP-binding protein, partial [Saprospiraceae bacterium]|nr:ATP-binding protein [Saprospiraceae bacterium]